MIRKYVYGTGIDEPVQATSYTLQAAGKYWYHADGLGSITALTDEAGNVVESYEYDAYGRTTIKDAAGSTLQASSVGNPYGFTGRELDSETGLYYYRARYYNSELGRFLQTDPVGYLDSMNLYQYCGNDPVNYVDPWGDKIRVYYSPAFGIPGLYHAFFWSTEVKRGKGMYGSSGKTFGDGVGDRESPYTKYKEYDIDEILGTHGKCEDSRSDREKEEDFIEDINKYPDWNQGAWYPTVNDCHNQLEQAFEDVGVDYPGGPGGRVDIAVFIYGLARRWIGLRD